jgi:hypothetical protein
MAQTVIALNALLEHLARAELTLADRLPGSSGPSVGWWLRVLDDSLDWEGPYPDPLTALEEALQQLIASYKLHLDSSGEALYWETPNLQLGDPVIIDCIRGSWTVTQLLDGGYVRVRERLRGITIDVDAIRCSEDQGGPPRASTA